MTTPEQKLAIIDRLTDHYGYRWRSSRHSDKGAEAAYIALASIAADLRGARPEARSSALEDLERRIDAAKRSGVPPAHGHLISVAHELLRHWPVVRAALQKFHGAE